MKTILVIEDDNLVRSNIVDLLNSEGYTVVWAENGLIGLQKARSSVPDLIICDIMMPHLDGYGVLNQLRQEPGLSTIPFIFLTAKAGKAELRQGMTSGADDYVIKPFTRSELLGAIKARLAKQETLLQHFQTTGTLPPLDPEKTDLIHNLRRALEEEQFEMYYQPFVDLKSGEISGAEALIRWNHPERKMIAPGLFIPLAEETGLISPIGDWIMHNTTTQAKNWLDRGLPIKHIAVNLSARQFDEPNLNERVQNALTHSGLDPKCLELELTETTLMRNPDEAVGTMEKLKGLGVELSIDDFGVGFSSFGQLNRFAFDRLKIDRSFVTDVSATSQHGTIVNAIIQMAHSLGLKTVAEGVETAEELAFLRQCNCDYMQGYYFARPMPVPEFENLLASGKTLAF